MAVITINHDPSVGELRFLGLGLPVFACLIGAIIWTFTGDTQIPTYLVGGGLAISAVFFAIPPIRKPIYLGWMYLAFPIGWTVSHIVLALVWYVVLTPLGVLRQILGGDPMGKSWDGKSDSYFIKRSRQRTPASYFRQF